MIRSPKINIIIKALDKISNKIARDFGEIENLQGNNFAVTRFANSCYMAVKERLVKELTIADPKSNIKFIDGEQVINNKESKSSYVILPIDGLFNLSRSISRFSSVIAFEEEILGKIEITNIVINNVANNQICLAAKNNGVYLNNRKIRVPSHKPVGKILCSLSNQELITNNLINKKHLIQLTNCLSLDVVDFVSSKIDMILIDKKYQDLVNIYSLLIKESSGLVSQNDDVFIITN